MKRKGGHGCNKLYQQWRRDSGSLLTINIDTIKSCGQHSPNLIKAVKLPPTFPKATGWANIVFDLCQGKSSCYQRRDGDMEPLERALKLRKEAEFILDQLKVREIVHPYSKIVPTGSYYLDVMAYPDIDLYIRKLSIDQLFDIGSQLAKSELVFRVEFEKSNDPRLPGGLYLKPRITFGEWGRPWKIDI
jgi:hypothetical protein